MQYKSRKCIRVGMKRLGKVCMQIKQVGDKGFWLIIYITKIMVLTA